MNSKRFFSIVLALLMAAGGSPVWAQVACSGWNNPTSFTFLSSANNESYSGRTGTKINQAGNCLTGTLPVNLSYPTDNGGFWSAQHLAYVMDNNQNVQSLGTTASTTPGSGNNQFRILTPTAGQKDPNCGSSPGLPLLPDENFNRIIQLGNAATSTHAEALYYDFDVSIDNALFIIKYAIVVEAPTHGVSQNPTFWIRVLVQNENGQFVPTTDSMCYAVSSYGLTNNVDHWHSIGNNFYRDWCDVSVSLMRYLYSRVRIEICMGDCSQGAHYGYCYIAGRCQPMNLTASGCASGESDTITYLTAPEGLDSYQWHYSNTGIIADVSDVNPQHYVPVSGLPTTANILPVRQQYFRPRNNNGNNDSLLMQTTFLCEMVSHMDPAKPFKSYIRTNVDNLKPKPRIDTIYACDNTVKIKDISTAYSRSGGRGVDYSLTQWDFYDQPRYNNNPLLTPVGRYVGDSAEHQFTHKGNHCVRVRCFNIDSTTCYADKEFAIRSITAPHPTINFSNNNPCADSLVTIYNNTKDTFGIGANQVVLDAVYHRWHLYTDDGTFDTTFTTTSNHFDIRLKDTCWVELTTHVNRSYMGDTNNDGRQEVLYCDGTARKQIFVEAPPTLKVIGDTIVCNGRTSIVSVQASLPNCSYAWYDGGRPGQGGVQLQTTNTLTTQPTSDKVYFVEVVSENGCRSWDSIEISILRPSINYSTKYGKPEICEGDTVKLWSSRAMRYDWYGTPADPSLMGQEHNDTVWATPANTTEFAVIGYGGSGDNECHADPEKQKIVVHPYPRLQVRLTPDYIDSDNPSVQFSDISDYGTSSLWDFGNGATATSRSIVYTFSDLSQDSLLIKLRSFNPLQCYRDTAFYIPVGIFTVWFPDAFTPRLETNKYFRAVTANELHDYELRVYDRAGALIFFSVDPEESWDGTYKGEECKQGAYVYIATYRRPGVERKLQQKGTVLLIK